MKIVKTLVLAATLSTALTATHAALPDPGMQIEKGRTALVVTDPQNDFLSPDGVTWGVVGKSVKANHTVEHIETLFKTAKAQGIPVFVSPHYYYPHDHGWRFEGALDHRRGRQGHSGQVTGDHSIDWRKHHEAH